MNIMKYAFPLLIFLLLSCKSSDKSSGKSVASNFDVSGFESDASETYTLYSKKDAKNPENIVEFIVLKNGDNSLAYGPDKIKGTVEWYDKVQLIVREFPGIVKANEDTDKYVYYIHIPTAKKSYKPVEML